MTWRWPSGTHPQQGTNQSHFVSGWVVELTSPTHVGNFAYVALIGAILSLTLVKGWLRRRRAKGKADGRNGEEGHAEDKR